MKDKPPGQKKTKPKFKQESLQYETGWAVVNSVLQALAAAPDAQGIYDVIGEKIRDIFDAQGIQIVTFDHQSNIMYQHYIVEKGQRRHIDPVSIDKLWLTFVRRGGTWLVNDLRSLLKEIDPDFTSHAGEIPKSALFIPLKNKGEIYGAISLSNMDRENAFEESDVRLLEIIAHSTCLALENGHLFNEVQHLSKEISQRTAELQIINSVQQGLASHLEVQAIYELVGDEVRDIFSAQIVMISTYDWQADTVEHRYAIERGKRIYAPGKFPPGGFRAQIVQTQQPVLLNTDVAEQAARLGQPTLPGTITPKSWLGVPMLVGDQVTGILSLQNVDQENAFDQSDVRLLQTLAASMSIALENARLFDETEHLLKRSEQRAAELQIINSVQEGLVQKLDVASIYELVGGKFRETFPQADLSIVVYDPETDLLSAPFVFENGKRFTLEPFKVNGKGFIGYLLHDPQPLLINENMEQAVSNYQGVKVTGTGLPKSALYVPLMRSGSMHGAIILEDMRKEHAFSKLDVRLLETLANSMSVALENAQLYQSLQVELQERKQAEMALQKANEQLQTHLVEIEKLRATLHEQAIRDPLTGLFNRRYMEEALAQEYARALRQEYPISVVLLDLDHLKEINSKYGHVAGGDKAIQILGEQLKAMSRKDDIVCRYGGDEFLIILHNTPALVAYGRAEQWLKAIMKTNIKYQDISYTISFSAGIAAFPDHGGTIEETILAADLALYQSKEAGRSCVTISKSKAR